MSNFTIEGTDELIKTLSKIDAGVRNEAALDAVEEGGAAIMFRLVQNAPVRTSALRNSIRIESRKTASGAEAEIGPHVIYARIQEFGGNTGRGHRTYIKGKHYLEKTVNERRQKAIEVMAATLRDYLEG